MVSYLEDPLTGDFSSRNELEEEEEAAVASNLADQYAIKPVVQVASKYTRPEFLIILCGPSAKSVKELLFSKASNAASRLEEAGNISIPLLQRGPALSEDGDEDQRGQPVHVCKNLDFSLWGAEDENILVATCQSSLPEEQSMSWACTVIKGDIYPDHVIVAGMMPAMSYRGPGDPSQEDLVFQLSTTAWKRAPSAKVLPPGNLVTGLSAAILQVCHANSVPACAIISVQNGILPTLQLVCAETDVLSRILWGTSSRVEVAAKREVAKALDTMYQSSASNSIYI